LPKVASGDQAAVAACIDRYGGLVWSLARQFISIEADIEDAVQEIFVALWTHADRFDAARAGEATFVSMIARRRLIDRLRKQKRQPDYESFEEGTTASAGGLAPEVRAEAELVAASMDRMKPEQREVLRLSAWFGMSHGAIARKLDLPLGTVKSHIRRGLLQIRDELGIDSTTRGARSSSST
jgi:RNA polymerase sigma-70 factor (ECF subfamily)